MEKILGHRIWNRYIKLYDGDYFPNGAKNHMQLNEWEYSKPQWINLSINEGIELREYQKSAVEHVSKWGGGLIEAPTGSGKSLICIGIANAFKARTLIICPTKKLVKEMVDKFKAFTNFIPGTYYSDGKDIKEITVTTTTSFVSNMIDGDKCLQGFDVVIVDECDDKLSDKFIKSICHYDCNVLVGMTGTANRQDLAKEDLELIYGRYIQVGDYQMLPTRIVQHVYKRPEDQQGMIDYTSWASIRDSMIGNEIRFATEVEKIKDVIKDNYLTLILLDRNDDVDKFSKEFPGSIVITGSTKIKDDEEGIERMKKQGGVIIGSLKKMYRGVDIPEVDCVVLASPVKFENTVIQAIGRALRKAEGKTRVDIHVINDSILSTQRREQAKVCKQTYGISPEIIYFSPSSPNEKAALLNGLHDSVRS